MPYRDPDKLPTWVYVKGEVHIRTQVLFNTAATAETDEILFEIEKDLQHRLAKVVEELNEKYPSYAGNIYCATSIGE